MFGLCVKFKGVKRKNNNNAALKAWKTYCVIPTKKMCISWLVVFASVSKLSINKPRFFRMKNDLRIQIFCYT